MKILFVCLGNICRSPLAEAVFANLVAEEGLSWVCDSAGTQDYHAGELADPRARACARRHGLVVGHRARGLAPSDFDHFDLLVAMDNANASDLRRRAPNPAARRKVRLMREWDPSGPGEVPDPYYGSDSDFETVWHLCERSARGLLEHMRRKEQV
jgi:protein-tyrosine phosphatase